MSPGECKIADAPTSMRYLNFGALLRSFQKNHLNLLVVVRGKKSHKNLYAHKNMIS